MGAKKKIELDDFSAVLKERVAAKYGPVFAETARQMGISTQCLHKRINKKRLTKESDELMEEFGYKYVTFVVPAGRGK